MKLEFELNKYNKEKEHIEYGVHDKNGKLVGLLTLEPPYTDNEAEGKTLTME